MWLVWNYLDNNKETAHTDGYICITEEIFFHFGFIIQVVLFKSKSPFCNWAWAFKEFGLVLFSISFRMCYNKDILIFQLANQTFTPWLWSSSWHNFQSLLSWFFVFWIKDSKRVTASFCIKWKTVGFWIRSV